MLLTFPELFPNGRSLKSSHFYGHLIVSECGDNTISRPSGSAGLTCALESVQVWTISQTGCFSLFEDEIFLILNLIIQQLLQFNNTTNPSLRPPCHLVDDRVWGSAHWWIQGWVHHILAHWKLWYSSSICLKSSRLLFSDFSHSWASSSQMGGDWNLL